MLFWKKIWNGNWKMWPLNKSCHWLEPLSGIHQTRQLSFASLYWYPNGGKSFAQFLLIYFVTNLSLADGRWKRNFFPFLPNISQGKICTFEISSSFSILCSLTGSAFEEAHWISVMCWYCIYATAFWIKTCQFLKSLSFVTLEWKPSDKHVFDKRSLM